MKLYMQRLWAPIILLFLSTTSLNADEFSDYSYYDCEECCHCDRWDVHADALFWKVSNPGIPLGSIETFNTQTDLHEFIDTKIVDLDFQWDAGFRLGAGYEFSCNCVVLDANWTHFNARAHKNVPNIPIPADLGLLIEFYSPWTENTLRTPISASGRWKMDLDFVDLDLKREFACTPCFFIEPFIGLRVVSAKQRYNQTISGIAEFVGTTVETNNVSLKTDFTGAGLRAGFDTAYAVGYGLSLYGTGALSLIYGQFHNHSKLIESYLTTTTTYNQSDRYNDCQPITDLAFGIQWNTLFARDTIGLTLRLGWEQHFFYNFSQFEPFIQPQQTNRSNRQDICFDGIALSAIVDF